MLTTAELLAKNCQPQVEALDKADVPQLLLALDGWALQAPEPALPAPGSSAPVPAASVSHGHARIIRTFDFKDYHETLAFVNAIAYVVHAEDHHPELTVTYNRCVVRFDTHSVNGGKGGLSINDFICAAKIDAIFQQSFS